MELRQNGGVGSSIHRALLPNNSASAREGETLSSALPSSVWSDPIVRQPATDGSGSSEGVMSVPVSPHSELAVHQACSRCPASNNHPSSLGASSLLKNSVSASGTVARWLKTLWHSISQNQQGRPARPQRAGRRGVRFGTLSLGVTRERRWRTFSAFC